MAENYPSNANRLKETSLIRPKTEIRSVQPSEAVRIENDIPKERPSGIKRTRNVSTTKAIFAVLFPDGLSGLKDKFIWEMLVPRLQSFLHDGWDDLGEVVFQGSSRARQSRMHTSYNSMYGSPRMTTRRTDDKTYVDRRATDYKEVVWDTREEAERLLRTLQEMLADYRVVRLLDYNDEVGNPTSPGQADYGWISLRTARIERTYDGGWVVVMPRPVEISRVNN